MKIKLVDLDYDAVMARPRPKPRPPKKPGLFFRTLMRAASAGDLKKAGFHYSCRDMEKAGKGPFLILMNHSSFIDLEMASAIFYPHPFCIVCTSDGFVGKAWLMRRLGCIPTKKFVTDVSLFAGMRSALGQGAHVLMYPEASYTFDGCAGTLPRRLGVLFKKLGVPVVTVRTTGAFTRDPLYNGLQKRQVPVSAEVRCLYSADEVAALSVEALDEGLADVFTFDHFAWQRENGVLVTEPFRADGLERILYRCPHCGAEGQTEGKGTRLTCHGCGKVYEMDELGCLSAADGDTAFSHIPDWYRYEKECVRQEVASGSYRLDIPVDICMLVDYKAIYRVGEGRLVHDSSGFTLDGCGGRLHYTQSPRASYGLYADYYWYERGDIICIGDSDRLFYCFPRTGTPVAKARLAAEELYRLAVEARRRKKEKVGEKRLCNTN